MNKHKPENLCPECNKITWNYNDNTKSARWKFCKILIKKKLHGIVGGIISKDENNHYTLSFPEYK